MNYTQYKYRGRVQRYKCKYQDGQYEMTAFQNGSLSPAIILSLGPLFLIDIDLSEDFNERNENATVQTQATGILTVRLMSGSQSQMEVPASPSSTPHILCLCPSALHIAKSSLFNIICSENNCLLSIPDCFI